MRVCNKDLVDIGFKANPGWQLEKVADHSHPHLLLLWQQQSHLVICFYSRRGSFSQLRSTMWNSTCVDLEAETAARVCKAGDLWQCRDCMCRNKYKTRLWEHIEAKHVLSHGYNCPFCSKFCSSKNAWHPHKSKFYTGCRNIRLEIQLRSLF